MNRTELLERWLNERFGVGAYHYAPASADASFRRYFRVGAEGRTFIVMVLTVEPGCYIRPGDGVPEHLWNIGVRIEDDAAVTTDGCEIITAHAPKQIADIEALMGR